MNIAKLIIPLITLPYLKRFLTKGIYGIVSYINAIMGYTQPIIDFGFILSGTNNIIYAKSDKYKMECEMGDILATRLLLSGTAFAVLLILMLAIPSLKKNMLYAVLSFVVVLLICFLFNYFFRSVDEIYVIVLRFFSMKSVSAALTFFL